jgi:sortase A
MGQLRKHGPWIICLLVSIGAASGGGYIWAKALTAQVLLRNAWNETDAQTDFKPWPWADTHPVGRLLSDDHDVDLIVLNGVSGHTMAFGPGHQSNSARVGSGGHVVLAAHRDTHFRFLKDVVIGDELWLEDRNRQLTRYAVQSLKVVDQSETEHLDQNLSNTLTLVTCYPFDSPITGGPGRYLVQLSRAGHDGSPVDDGWR